jgi:chromate transporter
MEGAPSPRLGQALAYWHRLGWLSFGGPAGQIAMMHTDLVERRRWVDESSFAHGLNYCMLLPGPEAMQLACYLGWRLNGLAGGLAAGALFVLPGALLLLLLSWLFLAFGQVPAVAGALLGLKAAVLGIVLFAVLRLARRILRTGFAMALALAALLALGLAGLPFPLVVLGAAVAGLLAQRLRPRWLPALGGHGAAGAQPAHLRGDARPRRALLLALALLLAWWLPLLLLLALLGPESTAGAMGLFFSAAALVTFGGAYAVLPFVAQHAVEVQAWLSAGQMLVGLGLAETTPGPLILVLQFVGFLGGWQQPDLASPLLSALLGSAVTLWATFLPSFLFVLPVAPWIERLREWPQASAALAGITAAVVGVMANLGLWFGWHLLAGQSLAAGGFVLALALASFLLLQRGRLPLPALVGLAAVLGLLAAWLGLV